MRFRKSAYVAFTGKRAVTSSLQRKWSRQGLRAIYEPNAVCMEETNRRSDAELKMPCARYRADFYGSLASSRNAQSVPQWFLRCATSLSQSDAILVPLFLNHAVRCFSSTCIQFVILSRDSGCSARVPVARFGVDTRTCRRGEPHALAATVFRPRQCASVIAFYKFLRGRTLRPLGADSLSSYCRMKPPDSGSLMKAIDANLAKIKVVSVYYRLTRRIRFRARWTMSWRSTRNC